MTLVIASGDVALLCDIVGPIPPPEIVWYANDSAIDPTNTKYYRDGGKYLTTEDVVVAYRCGVTNAQIHETIMSNTSYVLQKVAEPPGGLFIYTGLQNKTGIIGEMAEFTIIAGTSTCW